MNILLISPNTLTVPYPVYPLGLDYLVAALSPRHQVTIADLNLIGDHAALGRRIDTAQPDLVGLSCRNIDNTDATDPLHFIHGYRELVATIRQHTKAPIVCGGSGFTIMPAVILEKLGADFGIIGEGERLRLLADALEERRDVTGIPGIITPSAPAVWPAPWTGEFSRGFSSKFPHYQFYLDRGGMLNLQTKRGCVFQCIYCPYPHIEGRRHRYIPPQQVAATAISLQEAGAKYLFITDSAFNSDIQHSLAVGRAFREAGVSIPWGAFFAPMELPAAYFADLAQAGLRHVEFGSESLSHAMLATYRKPFRPAQVFKTHQAALAAGLHTAHYLLLGGPGETAETLAECLDNLENLAKTVLFFFIGIRIYPHTELHTIAMHEGQITPETDLLTPVFYRPAAIEREAIEATVRARGAGRPHWIIGSGGDKAAAVIARMHRHGHVGPLWEYLLR
jgi:radical SAM superfamily enzyme YgiQ (UPF0313 family)